MRTEVIAEIGQNHNGDIECAKQLIRLAKEGGADVAKFQVFDARALFDPSPRNPWFDYNCSTELRRDDVLRLADYCRDLDIEFMASVFDTDRIQWLEDAGVKRYKIASRSLSDGDLLAAVAATRKPVLASLGCWKEPTLPDIRVPGGIEFLYCVSKYPTPLEDLSLGSVDFAHHAGFSDHSLGITAACAAFVLGARILEKHFTLDKKSFGPDHAGSMDFEELKAINTFRTQWEACR